MASSAQFSTPPAKKTGSGKSSAAPLSSRIPNAKKTGNYKIDIDAANRRQALKQLLDELMNDDQHAPHLLCELHRRQESAAEASAMSGQTFKKCTFFGSLDIDWLVSWLTEVGLGASHVPCLWVSGTVLVSQSRSEYAAAPMRIHWRASISALLLGLQNRL